ncbi:hypothetical protein GCM10023083_50110 [Streptomyces phyllanthi]
MTVGRRAILEQYFPGLKEVSYRLTSPQDTRYNCIAWAAGDSTRWWEPSGMGGHYWPSGLPTGKFNGAYNVSWYVEAFKRCGYQACDTEAPERGFGKVAIFSKGGDGSHAARQIPDGQWASKLGRSEDIVHGTLASIEGETYGNVFCLLRKPLSFASA